MELSCVLIELREGSLEKVKEWAAYVSEHKVEALATLAHEKVTIESFFLTKIGNVDYLIGYMRAPSMKYAQEAVKTSKSKIDKVHHAFKKETWLGGKESDLLFDLSRIDNEESYA